MLELDLSKCTSRSQASAMLFAESLVTLIGIRSTKLLNRDGREYRTTVWFLEIGKSKLAAQLLELHHYTWPEGVRDSGVGTCSSRIGNLR
jgi:hypothetical protein